jgi:hypothetical protein
LIFEGDIRVLEVLLRLQDELLSCMTFSSFAQFSDLKTATSKFFLFQLHLVLMFFPLSCQSRLGKPKLIVQPFELYPLTMASLFQSLNFVGDTVVVLRPISVNILLRRERPQLPLVHWMPCLFQVNIKRTTEG